MITFHVNYLTMIMHNATKFNDYYNQWPVGKNARIHNTQVDEQDDYTNQDYDNLIEEVR